jgi:hypothetical protein
MKRKTLWYYYKEFIIPLTILLALSFPVCDPIWRDNDDAPFSRLMLMHGVWWLFCIAYYQAWFACKEIIRYYMAKRK